MDQAPGSCTVLVVGTDDWAIEQAADSLKAVGVEVLRCHEPGEPAFPCNAFIPGRRCPLSDGFDVALTARARPSKTTEPGELGVICALRSNRPLVVAGVSAHNPFSQVAAAVVADGGDAAKACRHAAGMADDDSFGGGAEAVVDLRSLRR
ncbi:MAG: hypothetical protein QOI95_269 [Acidimicrobiaceae bacterium]